MRFFDHVPTEPKDEDIFIDDVDKLVLQVYPDYEGQHPLFKKFGTRLRTDNWKNLSELEKWKYVALCSLYWEKTYKYWLERKEYNESLTDKGENK